MVRIEHLELHSPSASALQLPPSSVLRVLSGRLWLTQEGQPDDLWLQAGESFCVQHTGRLWLSGEPQAALQVLTPVAQASGASMRPATSLRPGTVKA